MKLIKITKGEDIRYFSTKNNAAYYIGIMAQNFNYYLKNQKEYKGWRFEECYDNVMSNEIDKEI